MSYGVEKLEAQRRSALDARNAAKYFGLCNDLGIGEHSIEDFGLYERGQLESENRMMGDLLFDESAGRPSYSVPFVARIALQRFPELERGERIRVREIKRRLGKIRKAGYEVKPYGKMNGKEAWDYLCELRVAIRADSEKFCPLELIAIDKLNVQRKLAGIEHR